MNKISSLTQTPSVIEQKQDFKTLQPKSRKSGKGLIDYLTAPPKSL